MFSRKQHPGGINTSNKIQSLWQPYGDFNTKTFITGNSEAFGNNDIGAAITPYYYYFTGQTISYENISQVDATGVDRNGVHKNG